MRTKNLLMMMLAFLQVVALSPATLERRDTPLVQQETRCERFKRCCCTCWHHPVTRVTVGATVILSLVALGMFIHVDLLNLLSTNISNFNTLTTFLSGRASGSQSAAQVVVTEEKTAAISSSSVSEHEKDLLIAALLCAHLRPQVCQQLHIEPGKPVSDDVLAMVQFFIPPASKTSDGRGGYADAPLIKEIQGDGDEHDPLYLEFAAQMEERARSRLAGR